jgi:hypothetical protein
LKGTFKKGAFPPVGSLPSQIGGHLTPVSARIAGAARHGRCQRPQLCPLLVEGSLRGQTILLHNFVLQRMAHGRGMGRWPSSC